MVFENNMRELEFLNPFGSVPFIIEPNLETFQDLLKRPESMKLVTTGFFNSAQKIIYEGHAIILINSQCVPAKHSEIPCKAKLEENLDSVGVKLVPSQSAVSLERKTDDGDLYHGTNTLADHVRKFGDAGATLKEGDRTIDVSITGKYGLSKIKQMELVGWGIYPALVYDPKSKALWLRDYQSSPFAKEYRPSWPFDLRFRH